MFKLIGFLILLPFKIIGFAFRIINKFLHGIEFAGTYEDENGRIRHKTAGCYVATAVYGSYDCPEVWTLRRYRDHKLATTHAGRCFIRSYYAVSPTAVRWFGETLWFRRICKRPLDRFVRNLQAQGFASTPYSDEV